MLSTDIHPFSWQNVLKEWVVEAELHKENSWARMILRLI